MRDEGPDPSEWAAADRRASETREIRDPMELATGPSFADDPLTQVWQGSDAPPTAGVEAVVALRERQRQRAGEHRSRRWWRRG